MNPPPPIFLIVGPPATGKSTTSRALAAHFPRSIHIPVDDLRHMVVCGLALPAAEWSADLVEQVTLARGTVAHMALAYHQAGFAVVVDDFWDPHHLADYQALLAHPQLHKVVLLPTQAAAHQRNLIRSGDISAAAYVDEGIRIVYRQLTAALPQLSPAGWHIVDTTDLDVAAAAIAILRLSAPTGQP